MREQFAQLQAKASRLRVVQAEADALRNQILMADDADAREQAAAVIEGADAPRRDKKIESDRKRLAHLEAMRPHAEQILTAAAIEYRNALGGKLAAASGKIATKIDALKKEIQSQITALAAELDAVSSGPELRLHALTGAGQNLLELQDAGAILMTVEGILNDHGDIIDPPKAEEVKQ
jgi:hypothetical protein